MRYEVQVDGRIATVKANSHGDAVSKVLSSMHEPKAVMVCELIEGAIKEYKPAMATVHESVQVDWMLAKDGSWDGEKLKQFARIMRQGEPELSESPSTSQVTARAVSRDTPPGSVAINYDPITDETSPCYHIYQGHVYRLATGKDLGATVWVSDHNFEAAIAEYPETLVDFRHGEAEPFATLYDDEDDGDDACTWKYAYVRDDSLLQSESVSSEQPAVNRSMAVSAIMEDGTLVGPPPTSREEIEKLNAD